MTQSPTLNFDRTLAVPMPYFHYGYRSRPGDIVELGDGRLLMAYKASEHSSGNLPPGAEGPGENVGIGGRYSDDGGRTWGKEFILLPDPPGQGYYVHPSFLRLPDGDLLLSYIYSAQTEPYYGHNYYRRSADDGATWSDQFILTPQGGYVIMHNAKLRQLRDGRILAPAEYKKHRPSEADHRDYAAIVFYSDTNGHSWTASSNDIDMLPHECQEPHVVELRDGQLLLMFRTYSGWVGRAWSSDRGETWSAGEKVEELAMSKRSSAITVDRIPSTGDLLLIRCTGEGGAEGKYRTPMVSAISRDEGRTWTDERIIEGDDDGDFGYQSVLFLGEGDAEVVVLSYHARDGIRTARIPVPSFYGSDSERTHAN